MKSFQHITAPMRIFQGADSLEKLGTELGRLKSRRAVIFCGSTLGRSPLLDLVKSAIGDRFAGVYAQVKTNSPMPAVLEAADELKRLQADAVIAFGGGSTIVTARAAAILLAEKGDVRSLCTMPDGTGKLVSPKLLAPKLPQLVIPTTPTTAAIKAGSAVLDPIGGERLSLFDPATRAKAIFIHPELLKTPSRELIVNAGVNTLALAIEGLMSRKGDPISDAMLIHAVRLLLENLPKVASSDDVQVRADLMMASMLCGHGSDYTGAGIAIPLGHAIGVKFDIDHGIANAIVLPQVLQFNAQASSAGIAKLAISFGLPTSGEGSVVNTVVTALQAFFEALGIPRQLRDVGVSRDSLRELAEVSINDWYMQNNPRPVRGVPELQQLLEEAW